MSNKPLNKSLLNHVVRVFVSSTYRNMELERNYLMSKIFPRVRQYCQAKDVEFVPIDLRWGITAEESQSGHVTEVCLKEIQESRPFFIGLLGEPLDAAFWLRSGEMPTLEEFCEEPGSPEAAKTQRLKGESRSQKNDPVAEYKSPEDLEKFGEQIYNELIKWIDKRCPGSGVTWLQKQNNEQSSFERSRKRQYVPRPSDYAVLDAFLASNAPCLTITGASGAGKSALLANWMDEYQKQFKNVYILSHYVSASIGSDSPAEILRRLTEILESEFIEQKPTEQKSTDQKLTDRKSTAPKSTVLKSTVSKSTGNRMENLSKKAKTLEDRTEEFAQAVEAYCSRHPNRKLVIVLDGMNQLNPADDAKDLTWFPRLPACVKVLFSTIDSDQTMQTFKRLRFKQFIVKPLSEEQRNKIIVEFLLSRDRKLTPKQTARIAAAPESGSPLILLTLLGELCVIEAYEKLDERIDWYLSANNSGKFFDRVLERLENDYGLERTRTLLTSLAVSHLGLSKTELVRLTGFIPRTLSALLYTHDSHIVNRSGLYDFAHGIIRSSILTRYASHLTPIREHLVDYFRSNVNKRFSRRCQELPWQYQTLQRWDDLYQFLLNFSVMDELYNYTLNCDFCLYWSKLLQHKYSPKSYFDLDISGKSKQYQADSWFKLAYFTSLFHLFDLIERGYTNALTIYRKLALQNPKAYRFDLAGTLNNLGLLHKDNGRPDLAEKEYNEALTVYRKLAAQNPEEYRPDLAGTLNNLGILHSDNGRPDLAEEEYNEALAIYRKLAVKLPEKYRPELAYMLNNLGDLHEKNDRLEKAEKEYNEALTIYRELATQDPETYRPDLAETLNNLGILHEENDRLNKAEKEYNEALAIYRELAAQDPETYRSDVARTLYCLGDLHEENDRLEKAEKEYNEALAIYRELATQDPETYRPDLAETLNNLGILHEKNDRLDKAEKVYNEALAIYRELATQDPETYRPDLAMTLANLSDVYKNTKRKESALTSLEEVLCIYQKLAEKNPDAYQADYQEYLETREQIQNM